MSDKKRDTRAYPNRQLAKTDEVHRMIILLYNFGEIFSAVLHPKAILFEYGYGGVESLAKAQNDVETLVRTTTLLP